MNYIESDMVNNTDYEALDWYLSNMEKRSELIREYNKQNKEIENRLFDWVNKTFGGKKIKLTNIEGTDFKNDKTYFMYYSDLRRENGELDVFVELYETDQIKCSTCKISGFLLKRMVVIEEL